MSRVLRNLLGAWLVFSLLPGMASAQAPQSAPWNVSFPAAAPPRVHWAHGLWSLDYRLHEALARRGGAVLSESHHGMASGFGHAGEWGAQGGWIVDFPYAWGQLFNQHVLIVANIDGKSLAGERGQKIRDFVAAGGGVLFLGGRHAFGPMYHGTPLEEICPVTFVAAGIDLQPSPQGAVLEPRGPALADFNWRESPRVFWRHQVTPKPESEVWLTADGQPLLIVGRFGKGRVAVFAGSVMGDPPAGALPFWKGAAWPIVMARTIDWLLEPLETAPRGYSPQNIARLQAAAGSVDALLDAEEATAAPRLSADDAQLLADAVDFCHDGASARVLMETAAAVGSDVERDFPRRAGQKLRGHVDASYAPLAEKLLASGRPYQTALGLRLLGMAGGAGAEETLLRFYKNPQLPTENAEDQKSSSNGVDLNPEAEENASEIRAAAVAGLAERGTPAALAALRTIVAETAAAGKFKPGEYGSYILPEHRLYQQALVGVLRCGDANAAADVFEVLMQNHYTLLRAKLERAQTDEMAERAAKAAGDGVWWQAELVEQLRRAPDAVLPALAAAAARQTDRRAADYALALFAGRKIPPEAAEKLKRSSIAAIRILGE